MSTKLYKMVNGKNVLLTQEEIEDFYRVDPDAEKIQLQLAKKVKTAKVKLARQTFQYTNLTVGGYEFKAKKSAKHLFFLKVNGLVSDNYPIEWRLADDISWVSLNETEASALKNAMEAQNTSAFKQESFFYNAINKAISVQEVAAIDIKFV